MGALPEENWEIGDGFIGLFNFPDEYEGAFPFEENVELMVKVFIIRHRVNRVNSSAPRNRFIIYFTGTRHELIAGYFIGAVFDDHACIIVNLSLSDGDERS